MANEHPFQLLFETLGRVPTSHAESVNRQAYEILSDILTVPVEKSGRCILLRAPRAGHGKTHLLSRIQHQLGSSHEFVPLHAAFGSRIDAASVTDDTLRRLVRQLPASGGLCMLDLVTRRLFASALQPLVSSGEVPCQDREGALTALRVRPVETFDFHHPNAVTAHWARENFEVLGQRLSLELAQRSGLPVSEITFWVDTLFRFASSPLDNSNRVRILAEAVHSGVGLEMERLEALLGLLTLLMRVVLVADDLEGFSTDETAALRLAAFLGSLRQSVERLDVILSLNQDIWQNAFVPRLSGGLADRLSEVVVELEPLTEKEMAALLDSRVPGLGRRVLDRIDVPAAGTHARGLIRAAGMAWLKATAMDSAPAALVSPALIPSPLVTAVEAAPPSPQALVPPVEPAVAPVFEAAAQAASPVSPEIAPVPDSAPVAWPAPSFTAAQAVEAVPEPAAPQAPVDAPVWTEAPPVAASVPEYHWTPPAPVVETTPEPASFAPSSPPQVDSPFQVAAQETVPTFAPPQLQEPAREPVVSPAPYQAPVDSPFQVAAQEAVPTFAPPQWHEPARGVVPQPVQEPVITAAPYQAPVDSPFQVAAQEAAPAFAPPQWQEPQRYVPAQLVQEAVVPAAAYPAPVDSPFQVAAGNFTAAPPAPAFEPGPEPVFQPTAQPAEAPATPTAADTDRVDDLLRQFRERYGRGSL